MPDVLANLSKCWYFEDFADTLHMLYNSKNENEIQAVAAALKSGGLGFPHRWQKTLIYIWDHNTLEKIRHALLFYALAKSAIKSSDFRDYVYEMSWYFQTAILLKADATAIFREVGTFAHPPKAQHLLGFANHPSNLKATLGPDVRITTDCHGTYIYPTFPLSHILRNLPGTEPVPIWKKHY